MIDKRRSMTDSEIVRELSSSTCSCGHTKGRGKSFCYSCFRRLTPEMRSNLYRRSGDGYEEAYREAQTAIDLLDVL